MHGNEWLDFGEAEDRIRLGRINTSANSSVQIETLLLPPGLRDQALPLAPRHLSQRMIGMAGDEQVVGGDRARLARRVELLPDRDIAVARRADGGRLLVARRHVRLSCACGARQRHEKGGEHRADHAFA